MAKRAVDTMNNKPIEGRPLHINLRSDPPVQVWVGGLDSVVWMHIGKSKGS